MEKKEWTEPELIVLVRSKPEEAVLSGCKGVTESYIGGGRPTWMAVASTRRFLEVAPQLAAIVTSARRPEPPIFPLIPWVMALGNPQRMAGFTNPAAACKGYELLRMEIGTVRVGTARTGKNV
ncbi:hypothetical protein D4R89_09280 [bacterium]|nr:MAG: hypothetical protein D4R89_09280 [bacterium]